MTNKADKIYDELLVLRCQDGEQMALEILVQRWQLPLLKFASIVCRNNVYRNDDLAREAVQDSWIAIIRSIRKLRDPARFRYWALKIVHRKSIDLLRLSKKRSESEVNRESIPEEKSRDLDGFEDQQQIFTLLQSLSEAHRTVLALHYLQDMALTEISELLDVPNGTVKSRLHHAREALKNSLQTTPANNTCKQ